MGKFYPRKTSKGCCGQEKRIHHTRFTEVRVSILRLLLVRLRLVSFPADDHIPDSSENQQFTWRRTKQHALFGVNFGTHLFSTVPQLHQTCRTFLKPSAPRDDLRRQPWGTQDLGVNSVLLGEGPIFIQFSKQDVALTSTYGKVFWRLKKRKVQKEKAKLLHQGFISRSKKPVIRRYTMNDMSSKEIQSAFSATGIYPLDR